jgi:hypothetical protein
MCYATPRTCTCSLLTANEDPSPVAPLNTYTFLKTATTPHGDTCEERCESLTDVIQIFGMTSVRFYKCLN